MASRNTKWLDAVTVDDSSRFKSGRSIYSTIFTPKVYIKDDSTLGSSSDIKKSEKYKLKQIKFDLMKS